MLEPTDLSSITITVGVHSAISVKSISATNVSPKEHSKHNFLYIKSHRTEKKIFFLHVGNLATHSFCLSAAKTIPTQIL